jgi:probable rRNA maturation factor
MNMDAPPTDLIWESEEDPPPDLQLEVFLEDLFTHLGLGSVEVDVLITDDDRMRALNRQYRDRDQTTDVLSFPSGARALPALPRHLGDIVISAQRARRQAAEIGHGLSRELRFLALHGVLHLLGYDHETDDGEMLALQSRIKHQLTDYFT